MTVRRLLKTSGFIEVLGDAMSINRLRKLIGADSLDTVSLDQGMVMLVDDEGIAKNLPVNALATQIYLRRCIPGTTHQIHGDVVIVPDADFGDKA